MNCIFRPLFPEESLWALKAPFGEYLPGETCVSAVAVHLRSLSFHRNLLRTSACCDLCRVPPCHSDVKVFSSSVVGLFSLPPPPSKENCVQGSGLVSEAGSCYAAVVVAETPLAPCLCPCCRRSRGSLWPQGSGLTFGRLALVLKCRWDESHGAFLVSCFSDAAVAVAPCSSCAE